jgi:hypothetical protein
MAYNTHFARRCGDVNDQLRFEYAAREELLRAQLAREREGRARAVQRLDLAEQLVERFMQLNFPVMHGQATAMGMDVIEEADQVLRALRTGRDLSNAFRRDTKARPSVVSGTSDETPIVNEENEPHTPPTLSPTLSSEAAITALQIIGETADYDVITLRWARRLGLDNIPERKVADLVRMEELRAALEELLDEDGELAPFVKKEYVRSAGQLAIYQKQHLVYLTESLGVPEYRTRFGKEPIHERTPVGEGHAFIRPQTYPSDECWWWTRVLKTLIERGNQSKQCPFTYAVYDPCWGPLPPEFQHRYPAGERNGKGSEPDLLVIMEPLGGTTVRVVIEFERANYAPGRLKTKIWKNLSHYQGFQGVYYVAPNRPAAKKIRTAIKKVAADAKDKPDSVTSGLVAVFRGSVLEDAWLPSPAQVDRFGNTPPDRYDRMAENVYYYKHKG